MQHQTPSVIRLEEGARVLFLTKEEGARVLFLT